MNVRLLITILSLLVGLSQLCQAMKRPFEEFDEIYQDQIEQEMQEQDQEESLFKKQRVSDLQELENDSTIIESLGRQSPNLNTDIAQLAPVAVALANQSISSAESKNIQCGYCDQTFSQPRERPGHIKFVHPGINPYACYHCDRSFTQNSDLIKHINSAHLVSKKYPCTYCDKSFTRNSKLTKHISDKHPETLSSDIQSGIQCGYCDQTFSQSRARTGHIKSAHPGINPNTCYYCNKSFTKNGGLTIHMNSVHLGKRYPCKYCDKSFAISCNRAIHIKAMHMSGKFPEAFSSGQTPDLISVATPYVCCYCNKFFARNGNLTQHINSIHLGKKYLCAYCDKFFTQNGHLKRHIGSVHSGLSSSDQTPQLISIATPLISLLSAPTPNINSELENEDESAQVSLDQEKADVVAQQEYKDMQIFDQITGDDINF